MNFYTGIGSRETPQHILDKMGDIGKSLADSYTLRSGAAAGADSAFEQAHLEFWENECKNMEIYLPWRDFERRDSSKDSYISLNDLPVERTKEAYKIASDIHPNWFGCSQGTKKLHTRNVFQVLGRDLKTPSQVVICWTKNGNASGGTATAINLAKDWGIPVWNLGRNA